MLVHPNRYVQLGVVQWEVAIGVCILNLFISVLEISTFAQIIEL